jgi:hypothetical protein
MEELDFGGILLGQTSKSIKVRISESKWYK